MTDELRVIFTYNHATGNFNARLENGSEFTVSRHDITGRLSNALELFRKAVINYRYKEKEERPSAKELANLAAGMNSTVKLPTRGKRKEKVSLDDLDLPDLEE